MKAETAIYFSQKLLMRNYCTQSTKIKLYTTPIYYVNANPHIGHLYSSLIADAAQRWQKVLNKYESIQFSTGTDEHGTKIQQASHLKNIPIDQYCNEISSKYRQLADRFNVQYTYFIRTTNEKHVAAVKLFWKTLQSNGHIYSSKYSGWYCISDETFLPESQLREKILPDGRTILVSTESGHSVEWTEEQNYMFNLKAFQDDLQYWLTRHENTVKPKKFHKMLMDYLRNDDLPDISISRPTSRVSWGVRVPNDDSQTIYVWLDALVNYLTVAGYADDVKDTFKKTWPPNCQIVGKDILKFHGIYWPAFLMAANLEPPKSILCHSHWTVDGEKMSKSKNNVICPIQRSEIFTSDGLRYFLLREGVAHSDGNYSDTKVIRILNSELADTMGNLLSRCCGYALNPNQVFPTINNSKFKEIAELDVTKRVIDQITQIPGICQKHYEDYNFYKVVDAVITLLHGTNLFFETLKPWELKKDVITTEDLNVVLHITMESLRISAILLQPIIPNIASAILDKLNISRNARYFNNLTQLSWMNPDFKALQLSPEKSIIFKRILLQRQEMMQS